MPGLTTRIHNYNLLNEVNAGMMIHLVRFNLN